LLASLWPSAIVLAELPPDAAERFALLALVAVVDA
jgi:hypothetical protein